MSSTNMRAANTLKIRKAVRSIAVIIVGTIGVYAVSLTAAILLRRAVDSGGTTNDLTATLLGTLFGGGALAGLFCLLAYYVFSFWGTIALAQLTCR